jgi:hypothetical protein
MKIDEIQLAEFFSVPPKKEEPEEKEFFGSSMFEVSHGDFDLSVSFSSNHDDMILLLMSKKTQEEILHVNVKGIMELRVRDNPKRLLVMTKAESATGSDPDLTEKVTITLNPLKVAIND